MSRVVFLAVSLALSPSLFSQALPTLSVTPTAVSFSFQIGSTTLPAPQTVAVKRSGTGAALDFTVTVQPASPWLIVTPTSGKTGTSIGIRVNPTSLTAGAYAAVLQIDSPQAAGPVTVDVSFVVKNPPPTMAAAPSSFTFSWQTDAAQGPAPQTLQVSTNGEPVSFTVVASGGTWLTATPSLGIAVVGSPVTVTASVDTTGLLPGNYTGKITITSTNATNKTISIGVTLTVSPGTATLDSIWPSAAPIGADDQTVTLRGSHLFKTSVVYAGATTLAATWISTGVMLAVIPKALLTGQGVLAITVLNSPQPASNPVSFTVTPPGPQIQAIVNSASFQGTSPKPSIAPGELITIFGSSLGPSTALMATPSGGAYPTTLGSPATMVEFEISGVWTKAPIIMAQANQINLVAPFSVPTGTNLKLRVTYNSLVSSDYLYDGVAAHPGIFTTDSSGRGQAAALNYNPTTQTYSLNSSSNAAAKGGVLILYLTGCGAQNPSTPDGQIIPTSGAPPAVSGVVSVTIGGEAATVLSATAAPGSVAGIVQLNLTVPATVKAAKDLAVLVTVAGFPSPLTATVAVK